MEANTNHSSSAARRCSTTFAWPWAGSWPATRATPARATPPTCGHGPPGARRRASTCSPCGGCTSSLGQASFPFHPAAVPLAGFYRFAVVDGYLAESPAEHVRRPKIDTESTTLGLDRMELGAFIAQAAASVPPATPWPACSACWGARLGGVRHRHRAP